MDEVISTDELREKYQLFFEAKGHIRIPGVLLIPENDPSVLFTTAGMHPLIPFLKGKAHPSGKRLTNVQKCLRTTDINEVGDASHATVFEMLGNWSLGDYGKEEAIGFSWEFLTSDQYLNIEPNKLAVSVFAGDEAAKRDTESAKYWEKTGLPKERIVFLDKYENWWPAGGGTLGPQGPDTEIFYWTGEQSPPVKFDPTNNLWVEIWNDVFMEFNQTEEKKLETLAQKNVDTGMGLERVVMVLNGLSSIYEIDTYRRLVEMLEKYWRQPTVRGSRIVADHIKAVTFVMTEGSGVVPSNKEQGYVLRRLIRRTMVEARTMGSENYEEIIIEGMQKVVEAYEETYPVMRKNVATAQEEIIKEINRFRDVLPRGLKIWQQIADTTKNKTISGKDAFLLHATYGLPIELTKEMARRKEMTVDERGFAKALEKHRKTSRQAAAGKFRGGLADKSPMATKYHTATHLLHAALRKVLGDHVQQKGSNITNERLRFDFTHDKKLTEEEINEVVNLVNEEITKNNEVKVEEMTPAEAKGRGAIGLFDDKYGDRITVYSIGSFSSEICGGPHVTSTGQLGMFKIIKEQSAAAGIRRIKAILE